MNEEYPEITIEYKGETIKSTEYGWDGGNFWVKAKDGREFMFKEARVTKHEINVTGQIESVPLEFDTIMDVDYEEAKICPECKTLSVEDKGDYWQCNKCNLCFN